MSPRDPAEIRKRFEEAVNMAPKELEEFLGTPESEAVGTTRSTPGGVTAS